MDLAKNRIIDLTHQFAESEWRCIETYNRRVAELIDAREMLEPKRITMKIHRPSPGKFESEGNFPDKVQLINFYRLFRLFVLNNEDSNFFRVANIVSKNSPNDSIRAYIEAIRKQWHSSTEDDLLTWLGREHLAVEDLIDPWFNAYYFHSDKDKEPVLDELVDYFGEELAEWLLYNFVSTATLAIVNFHKAIRYFEPNRFFFEVDLMILDHYQARGWI